MGQIIFITSGKGGSGKSTLAVNCGAALARSGRRVLLVDTDSGLRSLDLMLSLAGRVVYDLGDLLRGGCALEKAVIDTDIGNLYLLPAPPAPFSADDEEALPGLLRSLKRDFDYILVDSPAGIDSAAMAAAPAADMAVIVATPDPVCVRDADRAAGAVLERSTAETRLVINRVVPKRVKKGICQNLDAVIDGAAVRLLGIVPEDEKVVAAVCAGKPLAPSEKGAAAAFRNIARRIAGEDVPLMRL